MEKEHLAQVACECLHLDCPEPDLNDWNAMVDALRHPYQGRHDCTGRKIYPAARCLYQCGRGIQNTAESAATRLYISNGSIQKIVTAENAADETVQDVDGILVPGGFGRPRY